MFDNDFTVIFAIFMSLWGKCILQCRYVVVCVAAVSLLHYLEHCSYVESHHI